MGNVASSDDPVTIVLVGPMRSGKTIMARYLVHQSPPLCDEAYFSTVAPDVFATSLGDRELRLWDTSGEIRFTELAFPYIQHADAFLLVYNINDAKTFEQLEDWHQQLVKLVGEDAAGSVQWGLVGTHVDEDHLRAVSQERARRWASEHEINHTCLFECSGVSGDRVNVVFETMVQRVLAARESAAASPTEAHEKARRPDGFAATLDAFSSGDGAGSGYTSLSRLSSAGATGARRPVLFAEAASEPDGREVIMSTADGKPIKEGFWASVLSCGGLRR
mmetsp:Transcript_8156/g.25663  ORF Transcript_8156/g.25663 Transcript_8156/m.25663 type:complete len:277 (+) Transcript_8156:99-929(+)|eukprot:CAMPEP_0196782434 /NCGR_PEP_ID=MMETSP1104-20130614/11332_1 /TAXON_ID=33652 /ORGANISM="Cafeteria sp., Strain Caron Lab Isolate" /LENGTH=276 /DNA_ID=CAMNT_0042152667 /DNA_START=101 /DNA_END=931 /DNA_ORIENTATION=-